jgi:hypothetical protein
MTDRQVTPRFKAPRGKRERKARDERPGMSEAYLASIRRLPSCVSGMTPCQAHHLQIKEERGVGMRARDKWAVPLTFAEHHNLHRLGSRLEAQWFKARGVEDVQELARALWSNKHSEDTMRRVLEAHNEFLPRG